MRLARRTFLASTMATVAAPAVIRLAWADAPQFTFKLNHAFSAVSSVHDRFLAPWARQIQSQSGGRIRVDIFPSMQLGGAPAQLFDQARDGVADLVWAAPHNTPGRFPKIELFELPFVSSRRALVSSKAVEDYARANLIDEFREVRPICFSCSDRGVVHTNRPLHTIEDIRDLRLHVQTRFAGDALRALGARGVTMPSAQLPSALTQHVVDGCVDPWHIVPALKLNDLVKAHTEFAESSLSTTTFVLAMNNASYDRLPRDLKTIMDANSGQPAAGMAGAMWDLQAAAVTDLVSQRGDPITTLLPEAVAHWRKATEPVVEAWLKEMKEHKVDGGKLLGSARALLEKYAGEPEPQPPQPPQQPKQSQPELPSQATADVSTTPKVETSASSPTTPAPPASVAPPTPAKPLPSPARTAAPAKPLPPPQAAPQPPVAVPPTAAATPVVPAAPVVTPPAPAAVSPTPPAVVPAAPVVKPPLPVSPPKTLDIPI